MMATRRAAPNETARFTRWPGLLGLSLGVLLGPIAALVNEGMIYVTNMWACGRGSQLALHVVPLVCLIVAVGAGVLAYADWGRVGRGAEDAAATVDARSRFLALSGMATSAISALVILAQWLAIFVFGACMRS
jgi:hypothetical protein